VKVDERRWSMEKKVRLMTPEEVRAKRTFLENERDSYESRLEQHKLRGDPLKVRGETVTKKEKELEELALEYGDRSGVVTKPTWQGK
jgi:hypothetical protein